MLEPWMNENIQIVSQLSNIGVWNKHEKKRNKCRMEERT